MKTLIVTSHPDDLEFGMGATLAKLAKSKDYIEVHIFSNAETIDGNTGIEKECIESIHGIYKLDLHIHKYQTMHFSEREQDIRNDIYKIKQELSPDTIYCKSPNALHPDHIVIGNACRSIFLEQTIYAIEGIRDGTSQIINKWVEVTEEELDTKVSAINCYKTQNRRTYSDIKIVEAWARFRGSQVGVQYAEGFEVIREVS